jgi:hypothetical protein
MRKIFELATQIKKSVCGKRKSPGKNKLPRANA